MDMWTARRLMWVCYFVGLALIIGSMVFTDVTLTRIVSTVGIIIIIGGFIFLGKKWRCPHCGRKLPMLEIGIERCGYCNMRLK